jgi:hypothetical protein
MDHCSGTFLLPHHCYSPLKVQLWLVLQYLLPLHVRGEVWFETTVKIKRTRLGPAAQQNLGNKKINKNMSIQPSPNNWILEISRPRTRPPAASNVAAASRDTATILHRGRPPPPPGRPRPSSPGLPCIASPASAAATRSTPYCSADDRRLNQVARLAPSCIGRHQSRQVRRLRSILGEGILLLV